LGPAKQGQLIWYAEEECGLVPLQERGSTHTEPLLTPNQTVGTEKGEKGRGEMAGLCLE